MAQAFNNNTNCFNVKDSFNTITNYTRTDEDSNILGWLSPLEPRVRHQDIRTQRLDEVGGWLLETSEFKSWYDGGEKDGPDRAILFCYGDPGVGKSYITSLAIDRICDEAVEVGNLVACFYFDFAARKQHSPIDMLGSLLKQLISGLEEIPEVVVEEYRKQKKVLGGRGLQFSAVVKMVQSITTTKRTFIFVDALDECAPEHLFVVLDSLQRILLGSPKTRIFLTGRPHIRHEIERHHGGRAISVSIQPLEGDVIRFLDDRMRKDTGPRVMDIKLKDDILKKILKSSSDTFLLASFHIERVLRETSITRRRKNLDETADGLVLGDAYESTLERIRAQDGEKRKLAMTALMWLCYSERPLKVDELCHALAVEIGSTEFDPDNIIPIATLLGYCQGLVTVDKEASTVRLIHFTLQEYLSTHQDLFREAHSIIAETCLTYLNSKQVKSLSSHPTPDQRGMGFLDYSSRYWGAHAKKELSDNGTLLALDLLNRYEDHISAVSLLKQAVHSNYVDNIRTTTLFSGLHCASFFGIVELATALISNDGCEINQQDCIGRTPLAWASENGHDRVVELLLGQEDIDLNRSDNENGTPLLWAAGNGYEGVVKLLLEREDVDPNHLDNEDSTPLLWAAHNGHEAVAKLLLERKDVDPNHPDNNDGTPLAWAAHNGHEGVVKLLLEREDVDPNRSDDWGGTPLLWAAKHGHEGVVKLLLGREDVDPNRLDNRGGTPFSWAAFNGHEGVVKLFLEQEDIDPNRPCDQGGTPFLWAAKSGREGVVKLLLEREDIDPNCPDDRDSTPLSWAAQNGHEGVVKLLLGRKDVDPNRPDNRGGTPFSWAAFIGHEGVVKLFLEREDVDPNRPCDQGGTPFLWASKNGHEGVAKLLLGREDIDPNRPDNHGRTPLKWATKNRHNGVVKQLLEREDFDPNRPDNFDKNIQTSLPRATLKRHRGVMELPLELEDVDSSHLDISDQTPLQRAFPKRHKGVAKRLPDRRR